MPLVFVHGVANRKTPESQAEGEQRTALFQRLVLPSGAQVFDPDWGSSAVKFSPDMPWLPKSTESFSGAEGMGGGDQSEPDGTASLGDVATDDPHAAIDLAFAAALAARAAQAAADGNPSAAIDDETVEAFAAAVKYLEQDFDAGDFAGADSVDGLVHVLSNKLAPPDDGDGIDGEGMGLAGDALQWFRRGLSNVAGAARNVAATPLLRLGRAPLSRAMAYFLGDIFVYLQERGSQGWRNRIFEPIIADLARAASLRSDADPLIVVGHSLGGVILYDLLTDGKAVAEVEQRAGLALRIDALVTVGSQPSFFADLGLYRDAVRNGQGLFPRPQPVRAWLNVFDDTDVVSFACKPLFEGVDDYQYDNVTGLLEAHTAYFRRPSFYQRLDARLKALP